MSNFKENWERRDELCPTCGSVVKQAKGINRQNLKRLVSLRKPTYTEVIVLTFLLLFFLTTLAYRTDTEVCRAYVQRNIAYWDNLTNGTFSIPFLEETNINPPQINFSNLFP
jgi:hypothetical protein